MFRFNRRLAAMMARTEFGASIIETHHIHKKDAPSGTSRAPANIASKAHSNRRTGKVSDMCGFCLDQK